ncbi:hypothetical protein LCGC14_2081220 [marine sediment metagenome]|uniref:Uncharacterized protein n=1 Tax=marine sediment metagenome TaxID=412755 RepID=A0A0F9GTY1_9ZZZZ
MAIDDLLSGGKKKSKKEMKKTTESTQLSGEKSYKNIYMHQETIDLLHKIVYRKKMSDNDYKFADAIHESLLLLDAQENRREGKKE